MKVEIEAIRLALMDMMHRISRNGVVYSGRALGQCLMQIAMRVSTQALQILGGHGLLDEHPVEKWVRDIQMLRAFVL